MFKLTKTVSIITGASKGIGKSIAEYFADAGSHVVCVSRSEKSLIKVQNKIINIITIPFGSHFKLLWCIQVNDGEQFRIVKLNKSV